jgi:hypothetical protein
VFTSGGGSDADDLQSRLAASNGALQSLLRRLSTGMEDLLPNAHGRARMKVSPSIACPFIGRLSSCRAGVAVHRCHLGCLAWTALDARLVNFAGMLPNP